MSDILIDLTKSQTMILDTLTRALRDGDDFDRRRRRLRADPPDRMALWAMMADLGALGLALPEGRGGFGGTPRDMALLPAAIGAALPVEPLVAVGVTAARLLAATDAEDLLAALAEGRSVPVPALLEGNDLLAPPRLKARMDGGVWALTGTKPAVRHADVATHLLVSARAEDVTTVLALCETAAPGLTRETFRLIDAAGAADLAFDGTPCRILLQGAEAEAIIAEATDWTMAALAVEVAAICTALNAATFAYMADRKQFGQPLARFQALQFKAADMHIAATEAAAAADAALAALDLAPADRRLRVLSASLATDRTGRICAHHAVQLHGGMGVSDELAASHHARRLAAIRAQIGTTDARAAALETLAGRSAA